MEIPVDRLNVLSMSWSVVSVVNCSDQDEDILPRVVAPKCAWPMQTHTNELNHNHTSIGTYVM